MVETPRLQAKHVLSYRGATCHSGEPRIWSGAGAGIQDVEALNSGCRIKSGMTDDLITVGNQLILINPSRTSRLADGGCSVWIEFL